MSSVLATQVRAQFYLDSVALMRHSKVLAEFDGVVEAAMMMGTPANKAIMTAAGLLDDTTQAAEGGDLIISVRGQDAATVQTALQQAAQLLDKPKSSQSGTAYQPRSIRSAQAQQPNANLALISVPGDFAIAEARKAISRGLHSMIFSDNIAIEAEAELKQQARALGRIVMGPDCGTAIINGVPLAFANVVRRGGIAVIGASGTGIQEVTCLLDQLGKGISHAIGVGGRDTTSEVGGISTLMAIDMLESDAGTEHIVIISKPPAQDVTQRILSRVARSSLPFTLCFLGDNTDASQVPANATIATTLKAAAEIAAGVHLSAAAQQTLTVADPSRRGVLGLYTGGTLCAEAQLLALARGCTPHSNAPIPGAQKLQLNENKLTAKTAYQFLDLGADEYTQGQPHPMIEPSVRDAVLSEALARTDVAVVVLDVVLGYGSHADPAGHLHGLLQTLAETGLNTASGPLLVASVTGTEADPQNRSMQIRTLETAGVRVAPSNADAVELALTTVAQSGAQ